MSNPLTHTNPFTFGALALDRAFTDRENELRELVADMGNGQDVLLYAPRRYGKSSLVLRAAQRAIRKGILVGYCDLMRTPTKERLAAALAKTIYSDLESAAGQAIERATRLFRGLRITPTIEVDPIDGSLRFVFHGGRRRAAIDDTIEGLLALPGRIAGERDRRAVLIFDEFQEVVTLDRHFPNLMRAVFQEQPEVAHVYLGSKRHVLSRIFDDENEPFWRSAKRLEIGPIAPAEFAGFLRARFEETERSTRRRSTASSTRPGAIRTGRRSSRTSSGSSSPPATSRARGTSRRPSPRPCARSTTTLRSSGTTPPTPSGS
jgi:AAA+ ATPase superfamily predicted ATPase